MPSAVNQAVLDALYTGWQTKLMMQFRSTKTYWQRLAMPTKSNAAKEEYPFVEDLGLMQEYFGEMAAESVIAQLHTVPNRKFAKVVTVRREDIERDKLNLLPTSAASYGEAMALWPDDMLGEVLRSMFSIRCYDSQYFLDTDHPVGSGVVSNAGTKKLDFSTLAKAQGSFGLGKTAMQSLKDKDGKPYMISPTLLVVGADLEDMAKAGMTAERLEDGKNNIYRNACEVLMVPWMPANQWLLVDASKVTKPFIVQTEVAPQPLPPPSVDSDMWKMEEKAVFGCKARGNAHVAFWQLAWGSDGTVA
ncbi:Mu-like prophage major head subunit gpT family protein [Candidatus Electronema sp. JM]|uniref:Mu-like prophage major head subunit gpT family protein n=1 Tax=Candidatus Electronema sp. JM TaxID=3401571 RepID=UPI003AA819BA